MKKIVKLDEYVEKKTLKILNKPVWEDRPLLDELVQRIMSLNSEKEFCFGLDWLEKNFSTAPKLRFLLDNMEFSRWLVNDNGKLNLCDDRKTIHLSAR